MEHACLYNDIAMRNCASIQDDTGVCDRIEICRRTSETGYLSNLKLWYEIGSFPCLIFVKCQGWHNSHIKQMEYVVQTQQRVIETDSGPHTLYLIKVPEESQAKLKWWCFIRQIEFLCCNTTKHSSNLLFDISQLELGHAVRQYKSGSARAIIFVRSITAQ